MLQMRLNDLLRWEFLVRFMETYRLKPRCFYQNSVTGFRFDYPEFFRWRHLGHKCCVLFQVMNKISIGN